MNAEEYHNARCGFPDKKKKVLIVGNAGNGGETATMVAALDAARDGEREVTPIVLETQEREASRRSALFPLMMMGGMAHMYHKSWPGPRGPYFPDKPKPVKKCLQCGNEHKHNNSFCSPGCCKEYKNDQRVLKQMAKRKGVIG